MKFFLWILLCIQGVANDRLFEIVQPQSKVIVKEDFISVVVNIAQKTEATSLHIQSHNQSHSFELKALKNIYCKSVPLRVGNNEIIVSLRNKHQILHEKKLLVFYQSEVFKEAVNAPTGYKKHYFHTNKNEKRCQQCHNMAIDNIKSRKKLSQIDLKNTGIVNVSNISMVQILENTQESNCYSCHKNIVAKQNSHAPSINFACLQCHTGETNFFNAQEKGKSKFLAPDPIDIQCKNCHDKVERVWYKKESQHGPVMSGRCTKCHNPHSSNHEFFLRKPIWNLCTTCHDEKAKGKHVLSSFVFSRNKGAHPTKGRSDPARAGRELVCSSCHDPHGSNGIYLLRTEGKTSYSVCKRCHEK
jgi:predicted CXXCH cytochrome family protein